MKSGYLVIEGNIGAGKTMLARLISEKYRARLILEQFADNPFLPLFYENQERYSFPLEMSFLAARYKQLASELKILQDDPMPFVVADYYFAKSLIFAGKTLSHNEYSLYEQFFSIIYEKLPKPDLFVYLHKNVDKLLQNIAVRGRAYESTITPDYLEKIEKSYFDYFSREDSFPILIVESNGIDFVNKNSDFEKIESAIIYGKYAKGVSHLFLE